MQALEALIEYVALRSASQDAQRIEDLFKKYMELVPLLKVCCGLLLLLFAFVEIL